jgi:hypothetical protein
MTRKQRSVVLSCRRGVVSVWSRHSRGVVNALPDSSGAFRRGNDRDYARSRFGSTMRTITASAPAGAQPVTPRTEPSGGEPQFSLVRVKAARRCQDCESIPCVVRSSPPGGADHSPSSAPPRLGKSLSATRAATILPPLLRPVLLRVQPPISSVLTAPATSQPVLAPVELLAALGASEPRRRNRRASLYALT